MYVPLGVQFLQRLALRLAELYQAQGKYAEAEPLLRRSVAIKKKTTDRLKAKPPKPVMDERRFPKFPRNLPPAK